MNLHLLIPGLLELPAAGLRLPALSLMLGRGQLAWAPGFSFEPWLAGRFGLEAESAPYAALRLLGEDGLAPCPHPHPLSPDGRGERRESLRDWDGTEDWFCADPVQLKFTSQGLMLADASTLDLSMTEAEALVASLNQEFPDLGRFHAAAPGRWYLRLTRPWEALTHRLTEVVGRRVDNFLPDGPDGPVWRRQFNEIQVLLHGHPVNQAREEEGRPVVNSVWFWGNGALPGSLEKPYAALATDDPLARGLARQAAVPLQPWDGQPPASGEGSLLVLADTLARPALYADEEAWRDALTALEATHLAPSLAALKSGRFESITLTAPGDRASLDIRLTRSDLWKFWKKPLTLEKLSAEDQAGPPSGD
jgi:hypothetical protein